MGGTEIIVGPSPSYYCKECYHSDPPVCANCATCIYCYFRGGVIAYINPLPANPTWIVA
jgi:hypothetical protein